MQHPRSAFSGPLTLLTACSSSSIACSVRRRPWRDHSVRASKWPRSWPRCSFTSCDALRRSEAALSLSLRSSLSFLFPPVSPPPASSGRRRVSFWQSGGIKSIGAMGIERQTRSAGPPSWHSSPSNRSPENTSKGIPCAAHCSRLVAWKRPFCFFIAATSCSRPCKGPRGPGPPWPQWPCLVGIGGARADEAGETEPRHRRIAVEWKPHPLRRRPVRGHVAASLEATLTRDNTSCKDPHAGQASTRCSEQELLANHYDNNETCSDMQLYDASRFRGVDASLCLWAADSKEAKA